MLGSPSAGMTWNISPRSRALMALAMNGVSLPWYFSPSADALSPRAPKNCWSDGVVAVA
jgi:hypothetical protein